MIVTIILCVPLILAALAVLVKRSRAIGIINTVGYAVILAVSLWLVQGIINGGAPVILGSFFYIDALSAFFIFLIALINLSSSLYSIGYLAAETQEGLITERKTSAYYVLYNLFAFAMFFVTVVSNLGIMWVAIEMTTLISAFLVGFDNTKKSIEAAWKYIIICSAGIALALFGTILLYYTVAQHGGINSLNWTEVLAVASKLDPQVMKVVFLFILVGYGTKAGLAPMHTWLPDAHSQALSPVSALLSGVLLKTAFYAILRFTIIVNKSVPASFTQELFIIFGILSLGIAAAFILVQKDIKRLLAYSSVEHIGIISVGFGFAGIFGVYGALFHIFNHAITKSLMFLGAGIVAKNYKTTNLHIIKGVISVMPFTGVILILGAFALAGAPPFSVFFSEMMILVAGFHQGSYLASILFLLFMVIIFGAITYHFSRIIFGSKPAAVTSVYEPVTIKIALGLLFALILIVGLSVPTFFNKLILSVVEIIKG
ncbi:MAG: hypothetical protein A2293_13155 [Elusimicrobia bacterium RIFOXYB2_FULL_49_7]|nr:MAG: hypothetical protein A2293_13155 [Elusimicrobia bacterium RIFOXYB2_FULL_49_7]HLD36834.1 hydrogenase 4 subunit F [Planctomycetota bacterium]